MNTKQDQTIRQPGKSRSDRAIRGLSASYLVTAVNLVVKFFLNPFFLKILGPQLMGLRIFAAEILAYTSFADVGLGETVRILTARHLQGDPRREDYQRTLKQLKAACQIQHILALFIVVIAVIMATRMELVVEELPLELLPMARIFLVISGFAVALNFSTVTYRAFLQGQQILAQTSLFMLIATFVNNGLGFYLVYKGYSLYGIAVALVTTALVNTLMMRIRAHMTGISINPFKPPVEFSHFGSLYRISIWVFLADMGRIMLNSINKVISGFHPEMGLEFVTVVSFLMVLPMTLGSQGNRLAAVIRPGLTQQYHSIEGRKRRLQTVRNLLRLTAVMGVAVFACSWIMNGPFILKWVGRDYYPGYMANMFGSIIAASIVIYMSLQAVMETVFRFRIICIAQMVTVIVTLIGSLLFIDRYGVTGILGSQAIAHLIFQIPALLVPALFLFHRRRNLSAAFLDIYAVPLLVLGFWIIFERFVTIQLDSWPGIIGTGAAIFCLTLLAGIIWLWGDLKNYSIFRNIDQRFFARIRSQATERAVDRPLKVLFIPQWYPEPDQLDRGIGVFCREHARAAALTDDVAVLVFRFDSNSAPLLSVKRIHDQSIPTWFIETGRWRWPVRGSLVHRIRLKKALSIVTAEWGTPDVIWTQDLLAYGVIKSVNYRKIPVVISQHWTGFIRQVIGIRQLRMLTFAFEHAARVLPVMKDAPDIYAENDIFPLTTWIPNALDTDTFYYAPMTSRKKQLLHVSNFHPQKCVPVILDACERLLQIEPDTLFVFAGDGPNRKTMEQLAAFRLPPGSYRFTGLISKREVADLMRESLALVAASSQETFGCVLMEAMACGCIVITTKVGGIPHVVRDGEGMFVDVDDPEGLAEAMKRVIRNPEQMDTRTISENACSRFNYHNVGTMLHDVFFSAVKRNR
ncbi:glycosyltransferase [bacterium]|nr:glycosyltransferase [candidate division CSSED10-310 bacterium]